MTWKELYYFFESCVAVMFGVVAGAQLMPWMSRLVPDEAPVGFRVLSYGCLALIGLRMLLGAAKFRPFRRLDERDPGVRFSERDSASLFFLSMGFILLINSIWVALGVLLGWR
jgi:hypothetical protein